MKSKKKLSIFISFLCIAFSSCRFFNSIEETIDPDYNSKVTAVSFSTSTFSVDIGNSEYLKVELTGSEQNKCDIEWTYDKEMIEVVSDKYGAIITGIKAGGTYIKASCNGIIATCLISVISTGDIGLENSYIYSNDSVVQLKPGNVQTVTVGLYGGSTTDMEFFDWKINDSSIADITYSRNNCIITAKKVGHTQITASHPDSKYDYTFIVYVYQDSFDLTYITTSQNVLCLDKNNPTDAGGKLVTVSLINPISPNYQSEFKWTYADEESKNVIEISGNNDSCLVTPKSNGVAKINVTHKNAVDPISIIVRVTTIVQNTYINVSSSTLIVDGSDNWYSVFANIENYEEFVNPDKFVWGFTDELGRFVQDFPAKITDLCEITTSGNKLQILGKKNGTFKITVGHEIAEFKRQILVILTNQIGSAIDSSMYITTSDNYVITQNGADPITVTVGLNGGNPGDEKDFEWYIDGENIEWSGEYNNNIANITYVDGKIVHGAYSRAATGNGNTPGKLIIDPSETTNSGTFNITIRHPRCLYDCKITVKVYSKYTLLSNPITISTDKVSPIKIINGNNTEIKATLNNASYGGENSITWESSNSSKVNVSPTTGSTSVFTANGSGNGQTYVTLDYKTESESAYGPTKLLVLTADTAAALDTMKYISSSTQYVRLNAQTNDTEISVDCGGAFTGSERIEWSSSNTQIVTPVSSNTAITDKKSSTKLQGIKEGEAVITAKVIGDEACESVTFNVTVIPYGEQLDVTEAPKYLTTIKNAVVLEDIGYVYQQLLSVTGVNIASSRMTLTNWAMTDTETEDDDFSKPNFDLIKNGSEATISANKKGKTTITVSHPDSSNELTINAKCGSILEWTDGYVCYISTDNDVVNISKDNKTYTIGAALENVTSTSHKWKWQVTQGSNIVSIASFTSNADITSSCVLNVLEAGQAIVTAYNDEAVAEKEILVNVANSASELSSLVYLTTSDNVVAVGKGNSKTVSVSIVNAQSNVVSGYVWEAISGNNFVDVVGSGSSAVIYGKECGTAKIRISNPDNCTYPIEMIVNVVDPLAIKDDPYISCSNIVTVSVSGTNATLTADLIGGTESDKSNFTWTIENSSVAKIFASNNTAEIKGLQEGTTQVIISHPKAAYSRTVLIIVEAKTVSSCYIQLSQSIIKTTPGGEDTTITATLVNGNPEDIYNFKWWSSDYEKIDIQYTGQHCVIKPLNSGTVTVYCSHPKAANDVTAIFRISNFNTFAFQDAPTINVQAQTVTFLNLETPAEYVDNGYYVSYSSSNPNVCIASMPSGSSTSVCILETKNTTFTTSATITATIMNKSGRATEHSAQLLVNIAPVDKNKAYLSIDTPQTITIQKGAMTSFTVKQFETKNKTLRYIVGNEVAGNTYTDAYNLQSGILSIVRNPKNSDVFQVEAIGSGSTTITIKNDDCAYPLTIYVYVPGSDSPSINLNYSSLPLFLGDTSQQVTATIKNSSATPVWKCICEDGTDANNKLLSLVDKGNKAILTGIALGKATLTATITDNNIEYSASCEVNVREVAHCSFYTFRDEKTMTGKEPVKYMYVYPGQYKFLHYEALDSDGDLDDIRSIVADINKYHTCVDLGNKGCEYDGYTFPKGVGTIVFTSIDEGSSNYTITTKSNVMTSIIVNSSYDYLFNLNKSLVSEMIPPKTKKTGVLKEFEVEYEMRPQNCAVRVLIPTEIFNQIQCYDLGSPITGNNDDGDEIESGYKVYEFYPSKRSDSFYDVDTGIIKGTIKFDIKGEFFNESSIKDNYNDIEIKAINYDIKQTGINKTEKYKFAHKRIKMSYTYKDYNFNTESIGNYPQLLMAEGYSSSTKVNDGYSRVTSDAIIIGDGESAWFKTKVVDAPLANLDIAIVSNLSPQNIKQINSYTLKVQLSESTPYNSTGDVYITYRLYHDTDYGYFKYKGKSVNNCYDEYKTITSALAESINDTVKRTISMGELQIKNTKTNKVLTRIPVYLEVRNVPCMTINNVYNTDYTEQQWESLLAGK